MWLRITSVVLTVAVGIVCVVLMLRSGKNEQYERVKDLFGVKYVPDTDHGILSAMKPIERVEDSVAYCDELYYYMKKSWPHENVEASYVYGHYVDPKLTFDVKNTAGDVICADNFVQVTVQTDVIDHSPLAQSVNLQFSCPFEEYSGKFIYDTIYKYIGIEMDEAFLKRALQDISIGQLSTKVRGVMVQIAPNEDYDEDFLKVTVIFVDQFGMTR